ncbi:hypothetical protein NT2_05_00860 [Caenibius tardaugens NBRC 16725]|uniref:AntA/AntB antirepressor domain-containing protein n=1 Tax=Caenibius tardaugens NBRC 16725 TaxID=1219035 RepID=U2YKR1_9SPHN|nr:antA/AntB antirepressor family protein [Caenibius tardaugens]AZI36524.1 hypothetical protein EGO55_11640 [Caenibius tardaugens NBRC 16725]GAD49165.1 hypothetical protein NT2_05_00860 [Caenibius tardaugens NBRC 16725]
MRSATALAPVDHEGAPMIDARGLHGWLRVGAAFNVWINRRIVEYGFESGVDFQSKLIEKEGRGRRQRAYHLTIDMAKELAMVERTDIGRMTRRYFIKMEQAAVQMAADHVVNGTPEAIPRNSSIS